MYKYNILFFIFSIIFFPSIACAKKKTVTVTIYVTQTSDYCGGAAPSEEILQRLATPMPLPGKTICIKNGVRNYATNPVYKTVVADENGKIVIELPYNKIFSLWDQSKTKPFVLPPNTQYLQWDRACLYQKYMTPEKVIKTSKKENIEISINFHNACFYRPYCGTYSGPLPP